MTEEQRDRLFKAWADATARSAPELPASVRHRVLAAHAERGRSAWRFPMPYRLAVAGAVLALAAAVLLLLRAPAAPSFQVAGQRGTVGAWLDASATQELPIDFSEGTRVALGKASRGRVTQVTRGGAHVELFSGSVDAEVTHLPHADWSFGAGPFEVTVTGTHLNVAWTPASGKFELTVSRGSVVVKGPSIAGQQEVRAGQVCRVDLGRHVMELGPIDNARTTPVAEAPSVAEPTHAEPPTAESSSAQPSSPGAPHAVSLEQLLEDARAARLAGHPDLERAALLAVRKRAKGPGPGAQAAFLLGRASGAAEAARWFETYLREEPRGLLAREASGRLVESYSAAGDMSGAKRAASRYLAQYPNGPHAALARQALEARSEGQE